MHGKSTRQCTRGESDVHVIYGWMMNTFILWTRIYIYIVKKANYHVQHGRGTVQHDTYIQQLKTDGPRTEANGQNQES